MAQVIHSPEPQSDPFVADEPWVQDRPETLVICCSDGRWHAQVEQFVRTAISQRADMYAVPGGPACLNARHGSALAETTQHALQFLVKQHRVETIWLISHENCAFYGSRYGAMSAEYADCCQREDMTRASGQLRQWFPEVAVRQVHASLNGGRVVFSWMNDEWGSAPAGALQSSVPITTRTVSVQGRGGYALSGRTS
jgi:hypothetical protein